MKLEDKEALTRQMGQDIFPWRENKSVQRTCGPREHGPIRNQNKTWVSVTQWSRWKVIQNETSLKFLNCVTTDTLSLIILCYRRLSCAFWDIEQHSWSLLPKCQQHLSPRVTNKNISRHGQLSSGEQHHIWLRTTGGGQRPDGVGPVKEFCFILWAMGCLLGTLKGRRKDNQNCIFAKSSASSE